jgi:transposase
MTKYNEKAKAIVYRKNGKSINEIAQLLSISKSTASIWCRDIAMSDTQLKNLSERTNHRAVHALLQASERKRALRTKTIKVMSELGKKEVGHLSSRDIFMIGLGLYWGEGYKKGNQELGFTNSDLSIIVFYINWLKRIYDIPTQSLILRVSINAQHSHRINKVLRYWSNETGIPLAQFTKISLIKTASKKNYANFEDHYGTLRIKVRKGTNLRRKILGSISALQIK